MTLLYHEPGPAMHRNCHALLSRLPALLRDLRLFMQLHHLPFHRHEGDARFFSLVNYLHVAPHACL